MRINNDSRQRQRQTTAMAVGSNANNVEYVSLAISPITGHFPFSNSVSCIRISPEISKSFTDKRTEENEQLRVIVSATNRYARLLALFGLFSHFYANIS